MSSDKIETLDDLIRERAKKELEQEVKKAFAALRVYFNGGSGKDLLTLATCQAVQIRKDAGDQEDNVVCLYLPHLLNELQAKAVANHATDRGNLAVAQFLERAEEISDEIDELRSQVVG